MRKKLSCTLAALSILLVLTVTCTSSAVTTYTVGVPIGTTIDYSLGHTYFAINRVHTEVTGVAGPVVTFTKTEYNPDSSVNNTHAGLTYNITAYSSFFWFIGSNLTVGTPIYIGSTLYFVNETITNYSVGGASRTVNHMNKTVMSGSITVNAWWDKPTGLLVKWRWHQSSPSNWWVNYTLTSTSLWGTGAGSTGGGIPTLYLIGGGAAVVVVVAALLLLRRHK